MFNCAKSKRVSSLGQFCSSGIMAFLRVVCKCTEHLTAYSSRLSLVRTVEQHVTSRTCQNADKMFMIRRHMVSSKKKSLPFEVNTSNLSKDILVYSHQNDRFYKMLTYFGCAQFGFWAYLALFCFQTLKDAPSDSSIEEDNSSWWRRMAAKESKYKNGISILCFAFGYVVLFISVMYPTRAVRQLWLLKGGNSVRLETYSVVARQRNLMVPVNSVSCLQTRTDAAAQIPMKIRGRWFFFLLDKRGTFHNTRLFDFSVGLNRML